MREYRLRNPVYKEKQKAKVKAWQERNRDMVLMYKRKNNWKSRGVLDPALVTLSEICEICGKKRDEQKFALGLDHCHRTGKARGVLCTGCNVIVGMVESGRTKRDFPAHRSYVNTRAEDL